LFRFEGSLPPTNSQLVVAGVGWQSAKNRAQWA
jgi:hypothetical protein